MEGPETNGQTPDFDHRRGAGLLVAVGRALPIVLASFGSLALLVFAFGDAGDFGRGYDFRAYWNAGARFLATGTLYDPATVAGPFRPGPFGLYLYPPPLGVLLLTLQPLGLQTATTVWSIVHIALLALACAVLPVERSTRIAVFGTTALSYPALVDVNLGNVSILVLVLAAIGWRWFDRPVGSAAIAAAVALRSPMAIVLVWQFARRRWRAVAWTVGAGLAMILATVPVVGIAGYLEYFKVLGNLSDITGVPKNVDLGSGALALGASPELANVALFGGYALAVGAIVLSSRRDGEVGFVTTVSATLLLSPLLWDHYLVLLALPAALLASRGWRFAAGLPLLAWLPPIMMPLVAIIGTVGPLLAPARLVVSGRRQ